MEREILPNGVRFPSLCDTMVFITGGASGIGRSMVEHFHDQGSKVAMVDIPEEAGRDLDRALGARGRHEPSFECCDLLDIDHLSAVIALSPMRSRSFRPGG